MKIILKHPKNDDIVFEVDNVVAVNSEAFKYKDELYVYMYINSLNQLVFDWIPDPTELTDESRSS